MRVQGMELKWARDEGQIRGSGSYIAVKFVIVEGGVSERRRVCSEGPRKGFRLD